MYTLTHEPLALAGVLILCLAVAASLIVGAALWIRSMVLRRKDRAPVREALSAGYERAGTCSEAEQPAANDAGPGAVLNTAPGPEPAINDAGLRLLADYRAWLDADMPAVWPAPPVIPGRTKSTREQS